MKALRRALVIALAIVVAFGVAAPFLRADRFRPRIEAALEAALNRPVHVGAVHLNLFTGPGFTVDDVLIDDDPAAGIEPFAHVDSMQARIRWTSLFAGKLAFSSLRLDTPSVNVVKMASGAWNIRPLLDHRAQATETRRGMIPDIQIRGGRIDFKFGNTKSVFYISDADVDVYPNGSGAVVIRFSGAPARTDQSSQSFGELSARGLLDTGANGESRLSMGVHLDKTPISEISRLFHGSDIGVHGFALADARLEGQLSSIGITGSISINDVHRWDLMPAPGEGWTLNYRGLLNLDGHHLELSTLQPAAASQPDPVSAQFVLDDYLAAPRWSGRLEFHDLPAGSLTETAQHMGAPIAPGVQVDGKVNGSISYSTALGASGDLTLRSGAVKFPEGGSAQFDSAQVNIANGKAVLHPVEVALDAGQSVQASGEYALDNSLIAFRISTRQMSAGPGHPLNAAAIPVIADLVQGSWTGWVSYERTAQNPPAWAGQFDLRNAVFEIPGLGSPLDIASAAVQMNAAGIEVTRIQGHSGPVQFQGDYRYQAAALHPDRLRIAISELQIADAERLMLPSLRRSEGFLARTFRFRREPAPKWLSGRNADISLQVASLASGDTPLGELRAHVLWRGESINASNVEWSLDDAQATGKMAINLARAEPVYDLTATVENFDYRGGQLDLDGEFQTAGTGLELLANLHSKGMFEGRGIVLGPDAEMRTISGSYRLAAANGIPRLVLSDLQVSQGLDTLVGHGASQPDGHLVLDLTSGRKQIRLTGMLLPVHPESQPLH